MNTEFTKKLIAMIQRGTGFERDVAERKLREFCKKHNLSFENIIDEAASEENKYFLFRHPKYKIKKLSEKLFRQICAMVLDVHSIRIIEIPNHKKTWIVSCTAKQKVEIDVLFSILHPAFESEYETLLEAFVHRNNIFPESKDEESKPQDVDMKQVSKILGMAASMDKVHTTKQIQKL